MFLRRLALMALMMLLRMEQRACASGYVYCACTSSCPSGLVLYTDAFMNYSFSSSGVVNMPSDQTLTGRCKSQVCKSNAAVVCFSSEASNYIRKGAGSYGCGIRERLDILKGCESMISTGDVGYFCSVSFANPCPVTSCSSGYYLQSGTCYLCPAHYNVQPGGAGGQAPIVACRFDSTTEFTDAKGTFHFTNGCNYTS